MDLTENPDSRITAAAMDIVEESRKRGLLLRIMGAVAVRVHCKEFADLHLRLGRSLSDIDFAAYQKHQDGVSKMMVGLGYENSNPMSAMYSRHLYLNRASGHHVDIFFDKLEMCHVIPFANRLEVDDPTIPLAELLLEKTQIVKITRKDLDDLIVLFREHDMGPNDREKFDQNHIARILADDWGFYYTVTSNLKRLSDDYIDKRGVVSGDDVSIVKTRIAKLMGKIENEPKSMRWKMRARVGTKRRWYTEVENVVQ